MKTSSLSPIRSRRRQRSRNRFKEKPLEVRSTTIPINHRRAKWGIGLGMALLAFIALIALIQAIG
ncbi:MAG TPA: hypothetical protein DIW24_10045 [Bacteroidetes bacterium]|nr:hypothetical protein [Bacteroidota bacterium]HRR07251.1 hypothetical protein [Rhodothermales bacterium]